VVASRFLQVLSLVRSVAKMNSWWCREMDENEGGLCADAMVASAVFDAVVDGGKAVDEARP